jgi:hypothetical protein
MHQQVNLYQPIFREQDKLFSAARMTIGLGIFVGGLVGLTLFTWWRTAHLDRLLSEIRTQEIAHQHLVERVTAMVDRGETQAQIERRLATMATELDRRQQALRYLNSDAMGARAGFADRMEALARQQVEGLWLRGAVFSADSGRMTLSGRTTSADLVPIYLAKLAGEGALAGTKLELMEIRQPAVAAHPGVTAQTPPPGAPHPELEFTVSSAKSSADKGPTLNVAANLRGAP